MVGIKDGWMDLEEPQSRAAAEPVEVVLASDQDPDIESPRKSWTSEFCCSLRRVQYIYMITPTSSYILT